MVVTVAQDLVVVLMFRLSNSNVGGGNRCGSLSGACIGEECGDIGKDIDVDSGSSECLYFYIDIYGGGGGIIDNLLLVSRGHCVET